MLPPSRLSALEPSQRDVDAGIRQTDSDAALARLSAVKKGYLHDDFVQHLVSRPHLQPTRPPLINIGTYVRSQAIDELVFGWIDLSARDHGRCQIVSLGAGSDTRFWRIASSARSEALAAYIEIDFPENTLKKVMAIRKSKALSSVLGNPDDVKLAHGGTALHSKLYHLLPADLRSPPSQTMSVLSELSDDGGPILSPSLPTLLIFECVLVYMAPESSESLIRWFTNYFEKKGVLGGLVYEMFSLGDSFGKVMLNNLQSRNVTLPGAAPYPDRPSLLRRFLQHGFTMAQALTLRDIRRDYTTSEELERISRLEMLDEVEELDLVLDHYAITWAVKLSTNEDNPVQSPWTNWAIAKKVRINAEELDE